MHGLKKAKVGSLELGAWSLELGAQELSPGSGISACFPLDILFQSHHLIFVDLGHQSAYASSNLSVLSVAQIGLTSCTFDLD